MSFAESRATQIKKDDLGLDRTRINAQDQIQLIAEPDQDPNESTEVDPDGIHDDSPQGLIRLSRRKRLSISAKKAFHIGQNTTQNTTITTAPILADAPETTSDARLTHAIPSPSHHKLQDLRHDPVNTLVSKAQSQGAHQAASNLVAKEISHGREVELVRAHDGIEAAQTPAQRLLAIKDMDEMVAARQDMFVRWTVDRHVSKVRILPSHEVPARSRADFVRKGENEIKGMDWNAYALHLAYYYAQEYGGEYIGFTGNPPAPNKDVLIPSVERLLVASAPFQELAMTIRRIYRWDDRNETLQYLLAYLFLWLFNLVLPGILLGIIYLILHRKFRPPTIEDLRKDIIRTENMSETALTLAEFIEKEGDQKWLDPLVEKLGPWTLVQMSDLANLMEILRNFYEWRVPSRTGLSVGILSLGLIVVTFTPIWLIIRATTLAFGFVFFCLFPIASRFPDYRLIASPVHWMFWKIPTHAEWAVKALQAEGARHREGTSPSRANNDNPVDPLKQVPDPFGYRGTPNEDENSTSNGTHNPSQATAEIDYGSYKCRGGKLVITSTGIRFDSSFGRSGDWSLPYRDVIHLEKVTRQVQKNIGKDSGEDLKIVGPGEREYLVLNVEKRNEVFSQIVGFSDVVWQVVW